VPVGAERHQVQAVGRGWPRAVGLAGSLTFHSPPPAIVARAGEGVSVRAECHEFTVRVWQRDVIRDVPKRHRPVGAGAGEGVSVGLNATGSRRRWGRVSGWLSGVGWPVTHIPLAPVGRCCARGWCSVGAESQHRVKGPGM